MPEVEILESLPSRGQSEWLFPSSAARSGHLEEPKKAWQRIRERAHTKDVRIHDLRRTLGSWLAASGYGLPMIGRVLNHSQPSATAVYARLDLEPVRRALEANAQAMLEAERSAAAELAKNVTDPVTTGGDRPIGVNPRGNAENNLRERAGTLVRQVGVRERNPATSRRVAHNDAPGWLSMGDPAWLSLADPGWLCLPGPGGSPWGAR